MNIKKIDEIITIKVDALTLMAAHGNICLGLRHPQNNGFSRKLVEEFVSTIEKKLIECGLLNEEDIGEIHQVERTSMIGIEE
jgi:hypothetical protein